jgi:FkbM family methyltransferase
VTTDVIGLVRTALRKAYRAADLGAVKAAVALGGRSATADGFTLAVPPGVISAEMAFRLISGGIDAGDGRNLAKHARPGDFVLNLGGGCGLTALRALRRVRPGGAVVMVEPDPRLHELARENFRRNGMDEIRSYAAAAVAKRDAGPTTFYRSTDFWGSSLRDTGEGEAITVDTVYPPDLVDRSHHGRKILLCDIEGYETELLAKSEVIELFDVIIAELHLRPAPVESRSPFVAIFDTLSSCGFKIVDVDDNDFVFARV